MNTVAKLVAVGCALVAAASLAFATSESERPGGVAPDAWVSLGSGFGFVITNVPERDVPGGGAVGLHGFFVARHNDKWARLEPDNSMRVMPTGQR